MRVPEGLREQVVALLELLPEGRFGRAVVRVDERYSSAVVGGAAARDEEAAAVILQQWLDEGGRA